MDAHRRGERDGAERAYKAFLEQYPGNADALALYGMLRGEKGEFGEAVKLIRQAIALDPQALLFHMQLALVFQQAGQYADAVRELKHVTACEPENAEAWLSLARVAEQDLNFELGHEAALRAVELAPRNPSAYFAIGVILTRLERHEEAETAYRAALGLKPDWADAWDNLGLTYQAMNRLGEAEAAFRKAIDLSGQSLPDERVRLIDERDFGPRHWHLSQLELLRGKYELGFGRYRCRFTTQGGLKRMDWPQPYWKGEDIRGKTILVLDEEGRGDGLMMARYLPLLRRRGARVKFYIRPVFADLFKGWNGADEIIVHGEPIGDFDFYTWVFDLPYCFGTGLATVPRDVPYLPALAPDAHTQLPDEKRPKIGVVWAGSQGQITYRRHIPLGIFGRLFDLPHLAFYNLTRDKRPDDDEKLKNYPVTDLAPRLRHFGDLARFIGQMDLVISCDTATPHLAGGLGKRTWVLLTDAADWRWLEEREDSPWYPTARLFRQHRRGDWDELIRRVKGELRETSPLTG